MLCVCQGWQRESKPFETGQNENYALFGIKFMNNELPSSSMCDAAAAAAAVLRSPASLQEFILCHNYTHTHLFAHTHLCAADQKVLSSVVIVKRRENHKDMHSKQPRCAMLTTGSGQRCYQRSASSTSQLCVGFCVTVKTHETPS